MYQNVGKNLDNKGHSDKILNRNEKHVIEQWGKGDLYKVAKNLG